MWERRDDVRTHQTTLRTRSKENMAKSLPTHDSSKSESTHSLNISSKYPASPQQTSCISNKNKYTEQLKKHLDTKGQYGAYILELRLQPDSTSLTRRWAVVQNGFLRIYENYGCAAPFLRISLAEASLRDFSNSEKSRFCFMLEYGAGQSILFQTNTNEELQRWITVINLSISYHTDLFGSGRDLRRKERIVENSVGDVTTSHRQVEEQQVLAGPTDDVDGPTVTYLGSVSDVFESEVTPSSVTNGTEGHGICNCDFGDKENVDCTPSIVKEVLHHKSYNMDGSSCNGYDNIISRNSSESFVYRSSLMEVVKHRGYLRVSRGTSSPVLQFCELKGSLFSVYENEKSEKAKQVFNLLYDKYRENAGASGLLSFTLDSDRDGAFEFGCETEENLETWKQAVSSVALQEANSSDRSPKINDRRYCKCSNDSPVARKRSPLTKSFIEEEAMRHEEVIRSLNEEFQKGELKFVGGDYSCYVYEVRDSSGNKTIIRHWCVVKEDVIQIFDRETSREAVTELFPSEFRLKDFEDPRDCPFAFKLEPIDVKESEEVLVIQASNAKDFRELVGRVKYIQENISKNKRMSWRSESDVQLMKKNSLKGSTPLNLSRSDVSLRKEVKRIFSLARKSSKGDLMKDSTPPGTGTWPKVTRREKKFSRRAMSDTSAGRPVTRSLIESSREKLENRKSTGCLYDSEGKFSGYLTEVRLRELCRSEVRKWCVVQNRQFHVYDDRNTKSPSTVIALEDVVLVDLRHVQPNSFEFRVNNGVIESHLYRASSDFDKWLTVLAVAIDISHTKRAQSAADGSAEKLGLRAKRKDLEKGNLR